MDLSLLRGKLREALEKPSLAGMASLAGVIDHTFLKANAQAKDIELLCSEAREYGFGSVCVNSCWVPHCRTLLAGSGVKICTVVGFPLGAGASCIKSAEALWAIEAGAQEIDMVINIAWLKDKAYEQSADDIHVVLEPCHKGNAILKVIIETCLLTEEEKEKICAIAKDCGVDLVKTSTGFSTGGATKEDVALMRKAVGDLVGVKASGGVRTLAAAQEMIMAGATRLGTSNGLVIINEYKNLLGLGTHKKLSTADY